MNKGTSDREFITSKIINATRDLVFSMYSDADHIDNWWGPEGFETVTSEMNFYTGGSWRYIMKGPDGKVYHNLVEYKEIIKPERIIYTNRTDEQSDDSFLTIINFEETGKGTKIKVHMIFQTKQKYQDALKFGAKQGLQETLNRLNNYVSKISQ